MAIQGFFTGDVKIRDLNGVLKAVDGIVEVATDAGTVTSVGLTVGSTGTDVNVANSPITSSGNITLNLPTASATNRGLLSSADWTTFNNKQAAGNYVTLDTYQTITASKTFSVGFNLASVGGTNQPTFFENTNNLHSGSVGSNIFGFNTSNNIYFGKGSDNGGVLQWNNSEVRYYTLPNANGTIALVGGAGVGTVTSVAALTLGTSGTDLSSTVANSTTTPVITLNVPTASATNRGALSSADWTTFNSKQGAITLTTTGSSGAATLIGTTLNIPNYTPDLSGYVPTSRQLTINGTTYDLSANRSWSVGTVTSVGITMPSAFAVSSSPVTGSGTIAVTGAGLASQYVRGDGTLGDFPGGGGGGGASVAYYLNGSVNQGTFGGTTYYEMNKTPIIGAGTDFTINTNGYIASFLTDAGDPALLNIPGGNWNLELYFSSSSSGGSPSFYVELYKYDGTTFTLLASNSTSPEAITNGTTIDLYFTAISVPTTTLAVTDRLAIRVYVNNSGRTITLHTENSHLCEVITTFSTGLTALNGLTAQVQYLTTGTSGTDFNIASATATHTFNLPTASATNRGALSSADWTTFNNKQNALTNPITGTGTSGQVAYFNGTNSITSNAAFAFTPTSQLLVNNSVTAASAIARGTNLTPTLVAAANNDVLVGLDINPTFTNGAFTSIRNYAARFNGNISVGTKGQFTTYTLSNNIFLGNSNISASNQGSGGDLVLVANGYYNGTNFVNVNASYTTLINLNPNNDGKTLFQTSGNNAAGATVVLTTTGTIFQTGNWLLGTGTTDAGFRLDVNGTARIINSIFSNNGIQIQTNLGAAGGISLNGTAVSQNQIIVSGGFILSSTTAYSSTSGSALNISSAVINSTSGSVGLLGVGAQFGVSSGTANFIGISLGPTLNLTGTYSGIIRGYFYNPTLTSLTGVVSHRAFENVTGDVLLGTTSGNVAIGTSTLGTATELTLGGSQTASSAIARGQLINTTLVAAANNDVLVGLDINPTFTNGAFTGTSRYVLRTNAPYISLQNPQVRFSSATTASAFELVRFSGVTESHKFQFITGYNGPQLELFAQSTSGGTYDVNVMSFFRNGNVVINSTTDAGFRLDVNGTARVQDNLSISQTTTAGYALNITTPSGGGNIINILRTGNIQATLTTAGSNAFSWSSNWHYVGGVTIGILPNAFIPTSGWLQVSSGISIGNSGNGYNASAVLDVASTTKGFLPPRMTTTQKTAIATPATGLVVYDTTLSGIAVYNGTNWQNVLVPNSNNNVLIGTTTDNGQGTLQNTGSAFLGGLQVGGLTFSTSTTATTSTIFYYFNGGSGQTLTLPSTVGISSYFLIKNAGTAALTISRSGSTDTIMAPNGTSTTTTISLAVGSQAILVSNGAFVWIQII